MEDDKKTPTRLLDGMPWHSEGDCQSIWRTRGWTPPSEIKRREREARLAQILDDLKSPRREKVVSILSTIRQQAHEETKK